MVVKRGFLTKQGGSIKTWHKRWFVLDTHKVSYFKAQDVRRARCPSGGSKSISAYGRVWAPSDGRAAQEKALLGSFPVTAIDGVMEVCCSP